MIRLCAFGIFDTFKKSIPKIKPKIKKCICISFFYSKYIENTNNQYKKIESFKQNK